MQIEDFKQVLDNDDDFFCVDWTLEGEEGLYVESKRWETRTHFSNGAIQGGDINHLLAQTVQGKDVDFITRITGYFSRGSAWNAGKLAELRDRYRSTV